jgi:hypothetical protein
MNHLDMITCGIFNLQSLAACSKLSYKYLLHLWMSFWPRSLVLIFSLRLFLLSRVLWSLLTNLLKEILCWVYKTRDKLIKIKKITIKPPFLWHYLLLLHLSPSEDHATPRQCIMEPILVRLSLAMGYLVHCRTNWYIGRYQ